MFNRRLGLLGAGLAAVASLGVAPTAAVASAETVAPEQKPRAERRRRVASKGLAEGTPRWKRGKRAQARPKKRPNRLRISRRVRAKHRKAARRG